MSATAAGVCRHCACTEESPCSVRGVGTCSWKDASRTVCNGPDCFKAEAARLAKEAALVAMARKPKRYAGWGYGAIVEDLRRQAIQRKRRKTR